MSDERLVSALRSLPREQARPGFTGRVLQRLDGDRPAMFPARVPARWAWVAVVAALLALAVSFGWRDWQHRREQAANLARLETLLIQKQELEAELASLRRLAADARPVVYLGGNESVELTLDLARFQRRGGFNSGFPARAAGGRDFGSRATLPAPEPRPGDLRPREHYETLRVVY